MPNARADTLTRQWGERFRKDPLAAGVVAELRDRSDDIWRGTFELLQRESPEYRNSVDDEFTKESRAHCNKLLKAIIAIAAGRADKSGADPFDFVRTHAEWRARHRVPLIASLHAYRLAHKTYWGMTRELLLRHGSRREAIVSLALMSDFWIELFDYVGAVLAEAHAVEEGLIVAQSTRTYFGLIDDLLRGIAPGDASSQKLCTLCGIRPPAPMTILLARPLSAGNGKHVDLEATLRSFVRLLEQALPAAVYGKLVDIRDDEVVAIACSDADTARGLFQRLRRNGFTRRTANDRGVRVGIGLDAVDITCLPQAYEEARLALEFASAAQPLMHFSDIDLAAFLIQRADKAAIRLIPEWTHHFSQAEDDQSRKLSSTIHAFADCSFNVKETARRLRVHANTIYFRLNRIRDLTGIDPRTYSGTSLLLTTLQLLKAHGNNGQRSS
jgi:PucR C-terminal helix-turn-helix domain/GGDEF-like domain